jgi:hypothetical protein
MPRATPDAEKKRLRGDDSLRAVHHRELLAGIAGLLVEQAEATGDAYSIEEFCRKHRLSIQAFYKHRDLMPTTYCVGTRRFISRESAARWRAEREAAARSDTATTGT